MADSHTRKVVVVDDEAEICTLLATMLGSAGYHVVATADPMQAVDLVRSEKPDLVLCDIAMPRLDGYGVLRNLQSDPTTAHYPVIFLTGRREFTERVRAFRFGVVDYIAKPFTRDVLLRKIEKIIEGLERRSGSVVAHGREGAIKDLLDEVQQGMRSGVFTVQGKAGDASVVLHAGKVVDTTAPLDVEGAARAEFHELDPTREGIVHPEPTSLQGSASGVPSFEALPEVFRTVLIVDDNEAFRRFLQELFGRQGFQVFVAGDGEEGLRLALERRPWLIVTDVVMPKMNGFEFCRRVRSHTLIGHTPLVFLSGWDDYKDRYRGIELGADEYLSKDTSIRELLMRIHLILRRYAELEPERRREGMRGAVDILGGAGVIQMCHLASLTGTCRVVSGVRVLEIRFRDGEIVSARCGDLEGIDAVYELLAWTRGRFEFMPGDPGPSTRLAGSFDAVLLEGCRRLDEKRRAARAAER